MALLRPAPRRLSIPGWAVVALLLWFAGVGAFELFRPPAGADATLCMFRRATGQPCPTCGSTRAVKTLLAGDVLGAFAWNPFVMTFGILGLAWLALRLIGGRTIAFDATPARMRVVTAVFLVLLLANWAYVIWRHTA